MKDSSKNRYRHAEEIALLTLVRLTGSSAMVPISGSKLMLGRWQHVFNEFDGPRNRQVYVNC